MRMRDEGTGDITLLLDQMRRGDGAAESELIALVYEELRRLARRHLRQERPNHTLQTTALVHEAYLRLTSGETPHERSVHTPSEK